MTKYDPDKHHRRSIRLPHFDYTKTAWYFITICTQDHHHKFGHIENNDMVLNDNGKLIAQLWESIPNRFPTCEINIYQIMPNHLHGIIHILPDRGQKNVGAPLAGARDSTMNHRTRAYPAPTIGQIVGTFKSISTKKCLQLFKDKHSYKTPEPQMGKLWQRNFYEHIIRTRKSYEEICQYIINNPINWKDDKYYS